MAAGVLGYTIRRLLWAIPVLFAISVIVFTMLRLAPNDPVDSILGRNAYQEDVADRLREKYGYNDPLPVQYVKYMQNLLRGDLGLSVNHQSFTASEIIWPKMARWQPYMFGIGAAGISLFMMGAGTLGVARRHWDITLTDAAHAFEYPAAAFLMMGLNGIFAVMAAIGGAMYILVTVGTVLFGKKIDSAGTHKLTFPLHSGGAQAVSHYGSHATIKLPGTIILVSIFFASFVLYYFVNWKYLSDLWLFR